MIFELAKSNAQSPRCSEKSSYQLKDEDEEESEVEILNDTCNSKETSDTPILVKPLRSERLDADEHMDITLSDSDINGADESYCEELSETGDNGGSLIADDEQNYGQMVLYDPSIRFLSPIKVMLVFALRLIILSCLCLF